MRVVDLRKHHIMFTQKTGGLSRGVCRDSYRPYGPSTVTRTVTDIHMSYKSLIHNDIVGVTCDI